MKYLAFLECDNFPIVQETLETLKEVSFSDVCMKINGKICRYELLRNLEELVLLDNYSSLPQPWMIYDGSTTDSAASSIQFSLMKGTTLQIIEDLLQAMAHQFQWCIFNWGATNGLSAIGFISSSEEITNCFLKAYIKVFQGKISNRLLNPLISKYSVRDSFKDHFRALLIDLVSDNTGPRIWKACNCDQQLPWIVSSRDNIDDFSPNEIRLVEKLNFIVEGSYHRQLNKRKINVIEPQNIEIFSQLCGDGYSFDNTIIVVPSGSRLDRLQYILSKIELYTCDNYDIQWIDEITSQFDWFYGISRDCTDARYSLFFSKNASLLQIIDSMQINDDYELISCF